MKGKRVLGLLKNKYLITALGFGIWLLVFDQHNIVDRLKTHKYLNKLVQDTVHYQKQIIKDQLIIEQVKTHKSSFATTGAQNLQPAPPH